MSQLTDTDHNASWSHRLTIAALVIAGCLIMLNTSSVVDTARDVYNAWQIASGNQFPLEGPHVGAVFHGGPVWFYVLALPLIITPSWLVMNLWVGLLTGMKYALAYSCGRRLVDRNFGLMWACLLALPDWTSVNYLIFSHTNLVATMFLLSIYSLVRWQQGSNRWFYVLCLAVGLGIHAHPTVYSAGLVAIPFILTALWRRTLSWLSLILGALISVTPLLPYVFSQHSRQWPDLATGQGYFSSQPLWANLLGFFDVLRGALLDGPVVALRFVLGLHGWAFNLVFSVLCVILLGGLILALIAIVRRRGGWLGPAFLGATLLCIAAVAMIRDVTPFYQVFVIYPPYYALIAWGWSQVPVRSDWPLRFLLPVSLLGLIGFYMATLEMGREGHLTIPPTSINNVRAHKTDEYADTIYYPGWGRKDLGRFICGQPGAVTFHGFASLILEQSYALEARMRCPADGIALGGKGPGVHYLGISRRDARELDIRSGQNIGSINFHQTTQIISPELKVEVPKGDVYPPRPYFQVNTVVMDLEFSTAVDELVAITNLYYFWMPYSTTVFLNGQEVEPGFRSMVSAYYGCQNCAADAVQNWSVRISAPRPDLVEVVTFAVDQGNQ